MDIDENYKGREHSWVKHQLLESYLETVLSIIGISGTTSEITYVDCFAGPWGDESSDLAGTSIAISLRIIREVRAKLARRSGLREIRFRAIYVEENPDSFQRLRAYLQSHCPAGIEWHALRGDYYEKQDELLELCGSSFAFFFIDPKGYADITCARLAKLLRRPHSEFLINFMYDFLNRAVGMLRMREMIEDLIGELTPEVQADLAAATTHERSDLIVRM